MPQGGVVRLHLSHFRSYPTFSLRLGTDSALLVGPNGVGKTSLLEALSLLGPGRGLRQARLGDLIPWKSPPSTSWSVFAEVCTPDHERVAVATRLDPGALAQGQERRQLYLEGALLPQHATLLDQVWVVGLTPQMDGLLREGSQGRRRFLDHIVSGLDPQHHQRLNQYAHHMKERNLLLKQRHGDATWLQTLETSMAQSAVAIAAQRLDVIHKLQNLLQQTTHAFPKPHLALEGHVEHLLNTHPGLHVEETYQRQLQDSRAQDRITGQCHIGPHRTDVSVAHPLLGYPAALCSTGEQKALLISWVLAATELYQHHRTGVPLLLLDEVMAHLDEQRRIDLFEEIDRLKIQAWMTGTDFSSFHPFREKLQCFDLVTLSPA